MTDDVYRLLALCARAECDASHYRRLALEAAGLAKWEAVSLQAEAHGMAPLLYFHLKAAKVQPPSAVKRELAALYLRHRQTNGVRMRVLRDVLAAYDAAGIQALVLKGAALAHLAYPEPGLRPMSDLDILVPEYELRRAQSLLSELNFSTRLPAGTRLPHRHLPASTIQAEGLSVHIEIHDRFFRSYFDSLASYARALMARPVSTSIARAGAASVELKGPTVPPRPFVLGDLTAYTLGWEDMLWHLCQHLASHVNVRDSYRLIWVADIVSFAERFAPDIDWGRVNRQYPCVRNTLSLLHSLTPLSDDLLRQANIRIGQVRDCAADEYRGWPRVRMASRRAFHDTFFPSEWWLRLRYRLDSGQRLLWYRWVRHPLYIMGQFARASLERLGWPRAL